MIVVFTNDYSNMVFINTKMVSEYWFSNDGIIHINTVSSKHSFPRTDTNFIAFTQLKRVMDNESDAVTTEMSVYEKKQREKFRDVLNWLSKNFYTKETTMGDKIDAFNDLIDYLED